MPLAKRVIPTILCRGRTAFKGERFQATRSIGLAANLVRVHAARLVDEVVLLDIGATPEGRGPDLSLVEELAEDLFCPLAVGGGVRSVQDVRDLLKAGADKVVIGTARPRVVSEIAAAVGSQAVVVAIDYREDGHVYKKAGALCVPVSPTLWARELEHAGAGEVLLTAIHREGTLSGYDLATIASVAQAVQVPVVAHGGCRDYADMAAALERGASAVAAGALFQFTEATPREAAQYLNEHGIEARV